MRGWKGGGGERRVDSEVSRVCSRVLTSWRSFLGGVLLGRGKNKLFLSFSRLFVKIRDIGMMFKVLIYRLFFFVICSADFLLFFTEKS